MIQKIIMPDGEEYSYIETRMEPISGNIVYIVQGCYKGEKDELYGYIRDYYGAGTSFIYPSEARGVIYE